MKKDGIMKIEFRKGESSFPLVDCDKRIARIIYDENDAKVVHIAAGLLEQDICAVTGLEVGESLKYSDTNVVIGTIGSSQIIDNLVAEGKLDITTIKDKWETFLITTVDSSLVIVGADRRGTAFGVFTLSRVIGVSPWYWWSEVTPIKREQIYITASNYTEGSPSVKFRGLFINDEVMGPNSLHDWAKKTFEPEEGRIGPKTYTRVFELLLRLKANYCWPAMHPPSLWFNKNPANAKLAEDYAIVMGTSHCEQMLRNNMTEWDSETMGPWNYKLNRTGILDYWRERLETNKEYENTYTVGLRGTEDTELEGSDSMEDMVNLTQQALNDQRQLLAETINPDLQKVPQVLCLYKEVLVVYQNGLDVPEDITLLWVDDNHGYIRQLSTPEEQQRSGGSGVYYHLSLLGTPEGYLWLSTISPELMSTELTKAYEFGADRIWMFNVGDIKPAEKELNFAMDLAWDINDWTPERAHGYMRSWAAETFGEAVADEIGDIMRRYYLLAASGKPEHVYRLEYTAKEIDKRLEDYTKLSEDAERLTSIIPDYLQDAYFHLILYPVQGSKLLNDRMIAGRRSQLYSASGDIESAQEDTVSCVKAFDQLEELDERYNLSANGKWENFMTWQPRFHRVKSPVKSNHLIEESRLAVEDVYFTLENAHLVQGVTYSNNKLYGTENGGKATFSWESVEEGVSYIWIRTTKPTYSETSYLEEIPVTKLSGSFNSNVWEKEIGHNGNTWHTKATPPTWYKVAKVEVIKGLNTLGIDLVDPLFTVSDIRLSMTTPLPAEHIEVISSGDYVRCESGKNSVIQTISGLGTGKSVVSLPFVAPSLSDKQISEAPWVEYSVKIPVGKNRLQIRTLPNQRVYDGRGVRYAVSIDNDEPIIFNVQADEFSSEWQHNVIHGYTSRSIELINTQAAVKTIRIYMLDPGLVLRELIVDPA